MEHTKTKRSEGKRVSITVYMSKTLSERITASYAISLLMGYDDTKQSYMAHLLECGLATKIPDKNVIDGQIASEIASTKDKEV